jgi:hypothetical protein
MVFEVPPFIHGALARNAIPAMCQKDRGHVHVPKQDPPIAVGLRHHRKWAADVQVDCPAGLVPGEVDHTGLVGVEIRPAQDIRLDREGVDAGAGAHLGAHGGEGGRGLRIEGCPGRRDADRLQTQIGTAGARRAGGEDLRQRLEVRRLVDRRWRERLGRLHLLGERGNLLRIKNRWCEWQRRGQAGRAGWWRRRRQRQ